MSHPIGYREGLATWISLFGPLTVENSQWFSAVVLLLLRRALKEMLVVHKDILT